MTVIPTTMGSIEPSGISRFVTYLEIAHLHGRNATPDNTVETSLAFEIEKQLNMRTSFLRR